MTLLCSLVLIHKSDDTQSCVSQIHTLIHTLYKQKKKLFGCIAITFSHISLYTEHAQKKMLDVVITNVTQVLLHCLETGLVYNSFFLHSTC